MWLPPPYPLFSLWARSHQCRSRVEVRDRDENDLTLLLLQWDGSALLAWQMNPTHSYGHFHRVFGNSLLDLFFRGNASISRECVCSIFSFCCNPYILLYFHAEVSTLAESILRHSWINISIMGLSPAHRRSFALICSLIRSLIHSLICTYFPDTSLNSATTVSFGFFRHESVIFRKYVPKPLNSWGYWVAPLHSSSVWAGGWHS